MAHTPRSNLRTILYISGSCS